ncbi:metallophosphoesterase [uncultured Maricaulis sp.]|uniref:metallophosphoesterase family protein n=1 Tax=uncultured Maricaulis sp. TaxID=174710 RepID=UPI0030D82493|tara:strand:- start:4084 stop:5214 length:1131 start_codon:yes stop_codon:yes gene_type:complete
MTFKFIHSSDLHLGRRFANIPQAPDGNVRGRLMEARFGAIERLADAARAAGAKHILLAGDTFDTATPSVTVLTQALAAMGEDDQLQWWVLPGNHDNLRDAEPLWDKMASDAPANVHAVLDAAPIDMSAGATLLPCPVTYRSPGRDLTETLPNMPTADGALRIGLAHDGITDFAGLHAHIPPDRDRTAKLDYLALGDWHGRVRVSERAHYSGSPEQDRFKHDRRGVCLSISIEGPGAVPEIEEIETGLFHWLTHDVAAHQGDDISAAFKAGLPAQDRRNTLIKVRASGWASLASQSGLRQAADQLGPEFAYFDLDTAQLGTLYEAADLDQIDQAGALRLAAEQLKAASEAENADAGDQEIAADALARLYAYVKEADL